MNFIDIIPAGKLDANLIDLLVCERDTVQITRFQRGGTMAFFKPGGAKRGSVSIESFGRRDHYIQCSCGIRGGGYCIHAQTLATALTDADLGGDLVSVESSRQDFLVKRAPRGEPYREALRQIESTSGRELSVSYRRWLWWLDAGAEVARGQNPDFQRQIIVSVIAALLPGKALDPIKSTLRTKNISLGESSLRDMWIAVKAVAPEATQASESVFDLILGGKSRIQLALSTKSDEFFKYLVSGVTTSHVNRDYSFLNLSYSPLRLKFGHRGGWGLLHEVHGFVPTAPIQQVEEMQNVPKSRWDPASLAFKQLIDDSANKEQIDLHRLRGRQRSRIEAAFLVEVLEDPIACAVLLSTKGVPFKKSEHSVIWALSIDPELNGAVKARLTLSGGGDLPGDLQFLGSERATYISADEGAWYTGLPPISPEGETEEGTFPATLLQNPNFTAKLKAFGVEIPEALQAVAKGDCFHLPTTLRLWLEKGSATDQPGKLSIFRDDERIRLEFFAEDKKANLRFTYRQVAGVEKSGFYPDDESTSKAQQSAQIYVIDSSLACSAFESIACWTDKAWVLAPRDNTADALAKWLSFFPPTTTIEIQQKIRPLFAPPAKGRRYLRVQSTNKSMDWFDASIEVKAEDLEFTEKEIAALTKAAGQFVRLPGGAFARMEVENDEKTIQAAQRLGLSINEDGSKDFVRLHALHIADDSMAELVEETALDLARERVNSFKSMANLNPPISFKGALRAYQLDGFRYLAQLSANGLGGILADDMGLGKTVQALTWLAHIADTQNGELRALIVCPKSVTGNWLTETGRFAPHLTTAQFNNGVVPEANLVVINYAQMRLKAAALTAVKWDCIILDEAQHIKNPASQGAQVARDLPAKHRVVLTGTPVENSLMDMWSLMQFAMPGLLGSQASFRRQFNEKEDSAGARRRLAERIKHFLLRRSKKQVATDLPPRIEEVILCEIAGPQKTLYSAQIKMVRQMLAGIEDKKGLQENRLHILAMLTKLRQICADARLADGSLTGDDCSAKMDALLEIIEPIAAEGNKVLIFSNFVSALELIEGELKSRDIGHLKLTGSTENRAELVEQFQTDPTKKVFLISMKAGGTGLNLTAASYVVLFDPWWNPAAENQAIDRTHRIGQVNKVIAYRLITKDTIEEKIQHMQKDKAARASAVVSEEDIATVLDLDDLRTLLS